MLTATRNSFCSRAALTTSEDNDVSLKTTRLLLILMSEAVFSFALLTFACGLKSNYKALPLVSGRAAGLYKFLIIAGRKRVFFAIDFKCRVEVGGIGALQLCHIAVGVHVVFLNLNHTYRYVGAVV